MLPSVVTLVVDNVLLLKPLNASLPPVASSVTFVLYHPLSPSVPLFTLIFPAVGAVLSNFTILLVVATFPALSVTVSVTVVPDTVVFDVILECDKTALFIPECASVPFVFVIVTFPVYHPLDASFCSPDNIILDVDITGAVLSIFTTLLVVVTFPAASVTVSVTVVLPSIVTKL